MRSALTGAVVNRFGACACVACAWITAKGVMPIFSAVERRISTSAAAPSEIELEVAAVTVPSLRKAGFSVGIFSMLTWNGAWSLPITLSPRRSLIGTGAISASKLPSFDAACARFTDVAANSSCDSRVNWYICAHSSAKVPIERPSS